MVLTSTFSLSNNTLGTGTLGITCSVIFVFDSVANKSLELDWVSRGVWLVDSGIERGGDTVAGNFGVGLAAIVELEPGTCVLGKVMFSLAVGGFTGADLAFEKSSLTNSVSFTRSR